jgi:putative FmdB family regulatory protein
MPIYAYKCSSCGHAKDVLQKISDDALTVCPSCGQAHFSKQVTAAGFQLKGSGWYVTDFRDGANKASGAPAPAPTAGDTATTSPVTSDSTPATPTPPASSSSTSSTAPPSSTSAAASAVT